MGRPGEPRNYAREYEQESEQRREERAARNRARRQLEKEGLVHKGDGKDVDHKKPLDRGGSNDRSNLRVRDAADNRGWRKGKSGYNA
jgi:5-methylcytosine-specific restriction endonuclease McrA